MKKQDKKYTSTRIWHKTVKKLRFIKAHTGESGVRVLDRLVNDELKKLGEVNEN